MYCRYILQVLKKLIFFIFIKKMTYPGALKTIGIGFGIGYGHMPYTSAFKLYSFKTYTSAFENAGIGIGYASAFGSAGIG